MNGQTVTVPTSFLLQLFNRNTEAEAFQKHERAQDVSSWALLKTRPSQYQTTIHLWYPVHWDPWGNPIILLSNLCQRWINLSFFGCTPSKLSVLKAQVAFEPAKPHKLSSTILSQRSTLFHRIDFLFHCVNDLPLPFDLGSRWTCQNMANRRPKWDHDFNFKFDVILYLDMFRSQQPH